jgi:hypothetical protein
MDTPTKQEGARKKGVLDVDVRSSSKESGEPSGNGVAPHQEEGTDKAAEPTTSQAPTKRAQKRGGPTTIQGKEKSRRNATKHGLSAKVVLLEGESPAKLRSILQGYRDYFQPVGMPEEDVVQELAVLKWRSNRMLGAERAEIELEKKYNSRTADSSEHGSNTPAFAQRA